MNPAPVDPRLTALIASGAALGDAVRIALWLRARGLGLTSDRHSRSAIADFALRHGFNRNNLTASLYTGRTATEGMVTALISELGGSPEWWRAAIWEVGRPLAVAS